MGVKTFALGIVLLCAGPACAQRVFYDPARDQTAQDTSKAAADNASQALFDKMLRNADEQARHEADTTLAFVEQRMRAKLENFQVWRSPRDNPIAIPGTLAVIGCHSVTCELEALKRTLEASIAPPSDSARVAARIASIRAKKAELEKQLAALKASSAPASQQLYGALDSGAGLLDYARRITSHAGSSGQLNALDAIEAGLGQSLVLYRVVQAIWDGRQAVSVPPGSLRPTPESIELQLLAIEEQHLNTLARIEARKHLEAGAALEAVTTALSRLAGARVTTSNASVEETLRAAAAAHDRARLERLIGALHESAAALAQLDASVQLAELRKADEQRRYAIRRAAVNGGVFDETIRAAAQRLALYWKSGIKPSELAQLVFYVTNAAAVPWIAAK